MTRKAKDLFVVLSERNTPRSALGSAPRRREPVKRGQEPGLGERLAGWFRQTFQSLQGDKSKSKGKSKAKAQPRGRNVGQAAGNRVPKGLLMPGWMLAGMLVLALLGGFGFSQFNRGKGGDKVLATGPQAQGELDLNHGLDWSGVANAEKEQEIPCKFFYMVLPFPSLSLPLQRQRASRLALYLRERGLDNARIRKFPYKGKDLWVTLLYVPSLEQGSKSLQQLKAIAAPDFEPNFAPRVGTLTSKSFRKM